MRHLLKDFGYLKREAFPIYQDNQACKECYRSGSNQAHQNFVLLLPLSCLVSRSQARVPPTELVLADALTEALCKVEFAELATSILIQDTRLDQSRSVEEQAKAARLVSIRPRSNPSKQESTHMPR